MFASHKLRFMPFGILALIDIVVLVRRLFIKTAISIDA